MRNMLFKLRVFGNIQEQKPNVINYKLIAYLLLFASSEMPFGQLCRTELLHFYIDKIIFFLKYANFFLGIRNL